MVSEDIKSYLIKEIIQTPIFKEAFRGGFDQLGKLVDKLIDDNGVKYEIHALLHKAFLLAIKYQQAQCD